MELRGRTAHYGTLTETHGAWEAVWTEDGAAYAVVAGASVELDGDGFETLVAGLSRP